MIFKVFGSEVLGNMENMLDEKTPHKIGHIIYFLLFIMLIIFTISFYNYAGLDLLMYLGWILVVIGFTVFVYSVKTRKKMVIDTQKPERKVLIITGAYSLVRHPEFLGHILIISGLFLISQHLISLVIYSIMIIMLYSAIVEEEEKNIEKFGEQYKDYMKKVPRINLIVGIIRYIKSEKKTRK